MTDIIESAALHSTHNGSDKVYNVQIVTAEGGFVVNYQNGKRGGTLTSGTKTKTPVDLATAKKKFDALVKEKINGDSHYRPVAANPDDYVAPVEKEATGLDPMLLTAITLDKALSLLDNDSYILQRKHDGERLMTMFSMNTLIGSNKKGYRRGVPAVVAAALASEPSAKFDGELVGNIYHVFDILSFKGEDLSCRPYAVRLALLKKAVTKIGNANVRLVETFYGKEAKSKAMSDIKESNGEGVVFKHLDDHYEPGRFENIFKYKFTATATFIVTGHSKTVRSISIGTHDNGKTKTNCKVTVPQNVGIPPIGAFVEVEYLYAYRGTDALAQPVLKGERNDQDESDCSVSQLKYKEVIEEDDE